MSKCPSCDARFDGQQCACGYRAKSLMPCGPRRCSWTTESRSCGMLATNSGLCAWHRDWHRLISEGAPGRTEQDELADWLEQYRPYGPYGSSYGQWWADLGVLWAALRGFAPAPLLTVAIDRELFARGCDVHRYRHGLPALVNAPFSRLCGPPLPPWDATVWQIKVDALVNQRRADERSALHRDHQKLRATSGMR